MFSKFYVNGNLIDFNCAGTFNGKADGIDKVLDGKVWGDPFYANDHLSMKWNAAWDSCNHLGTPAACAGAWTDNEWNGKVRGGISQGTAGGTHIWDVLASRRDTAAAR